MRKKKKTAYQVFATIKGKRSSFTGYLTKKDAKKYVKQFKSGNRLGIIPGDKVGERTEGKMKYIKVKKVRYIPFF